MLELVAHEYRHAASFFHNGAERIELGLVDFLEGFPVGIDRSARELQALARFNCGVHRFDFRAGFKLSQKLPLEFCVKAPCRVGQINRNSGEDRLLHIEPLLRIDLQHDVTDLVVNQPVGAGERFVAHGQRG